MDKFSSKDVTNPSDAIVITNKNIPYYLIAAGLFILLKFAYTLANNDSLIFLLAPTDKLIGLLTGSHSVYFSDKGYFHQTLNILIEKSCSGFNFWLICFCMLAFLMLKYINKPFFKALTIPASLIFAYIETIFVNASRIFSSIVVQNLANHFIPERPHFLLHEIVGVIINLAFLILIYYFSEKFLINIYRHAKLA